MAHDSTITENDVDNSSRNTVDGLRGDGVVEPDLDVDGLSDSFLSRILGLFGYKKH